MRPSLVLIALLLASAAPAHAVVGGQEVRSVPRFMALVEPDRTADGQQPFCGGTLVAARWVLTAAHCLPLTGDLHVVLGRRDRSLAGTGTRIPVLATFVHPAWETHGDDVALLQLERAPRRPRPVRVAGPGESIAWAPGSQATIFGWGATEEGGPASRALRQARVPVVADVDCAAAYAGHGWTWEDQTMLCAGDPEGGTDTCHGDSGGPLLVRRRGGPARVAGVTASGEGCGRPGYPGIYVEAAADRIHLWIRSIAPAAVAGGARGASASRLPSSRRAACRHRARGFNSTDRRRRALRRCARLR